MSKRNTVVSSCTTILFPNFNIGKLNLGPLINVVAGDIYPKLVLKQKINILSYSKCQIS